MEKRHTLYFKVSVAIAAVAGVPIYFLSNYFFWHDRDMLRGVWEIFWVNLLIFPEITQYLILPAVITAVLGLVGVLWARVVWLGFLGEFLYIFLNVLIFHVSVDRAHLLDPMNIAGITLLLGSISFGAASLGIKRMSFRPAADVMVRGTIAFFVLGIIMLIGIMVPYGFRITPISPNDTWSVPWTWGGIEVSLFASALILLSKVLLIVLFSLGIVALLRKWRYAYLYASLVLFLFGLKWLEMIVPIVDTSSDLEGLFGDPELGFSYGLFYKILFAIYVFLREKILIRAAMAIPSLLSFLLGFLFLFHIDKKAPDAS